MHSQSRQAAALKAQDLFFGGSLRNGNQLHLVWDKKRFWRLFTLNAIPWGTHRRAYTRQKSDFVSDTKAGEKRIFNNFEYGPEGFYRAMRKYESPRMDSIRSTGADCFSLDLKTECLGSTLPKKTL